jgi:hypothetical protein
MTCSQLLHVIARLFRALTVVHQPPLFPRIFFCFWRNAALGWPLLELILLGQPVRCTSLHVDPCQYTHCFVMNLSIIQPFIYSFLFRVVSPFG